MFGKDGHVHESGSMIRFTENKNQWPEQVLYKAQLDGGALFLEKNAFTYNFYDKETLRNNHLGKSVMNKPKDHFTGHAFRMTFLNALASVKINANNPSSDYCNYFIGNDKSKWAGNVKNFKEVNYTNLYSSIRLQILGDDNSIKYNFFVAPGGNTNDIKMSYEGLSSIQLENGQLKLKTTLNELNEQRPYAYQWIGKKKVEVPCEFTLQHNIVQFKFPEGYDKESELIIDPLLVFAASSGSIADNFGHAATYDNQGNLYSGGIAFSAGYPLKPGAYDSSYNGEVDVVITKYNAIGTDLIYSTYLGGALDEIVTSLIVDAQNNLYMYGVTGSADFPVTATAYDQTFNGGTYYYAHQNNGNVFPNGTDIFVSELNSTGSSLLASSFIGGSSNDGVNSNNSTISFPGIPPPGVPPLDSLQYNYGDYYRGALDLDPLGNVYITTSSRSADFPIINGFGTALKGAQDAVVFKMNSDLSQLLWSTYLGGDDNDAGYGLVFDDSYNVYVCGGTRSKNFPFTTGTLQTTFGGGKADGFITKIKNDGTAILASTYWGKTTYDQCFYIQLDRNNDVYVVGQTDGAMPVTPVGVYNNPNSGQFISKLNNTFDKLIFSTVFGNGNGVPNICPTAFLVDDCQNIYVSGWATAFKSPVPAATRMPVSSNAIDGTTLGYDFYLIVLSTDAKSFIYGTYYGGDISGEHVHGGTSRFDKKGIVYQSLCTGCGGQQDFPVTAGSWPQTGPINGSNCNNGVFKIDFQVPPVNAQFSVDSTKGCAPFKVKFNNQSTSWTNYLWDFGGGDTTSSDFEPIKTYTIPGTYTIKLFTENRACNTKDTAVITLSVYPSITADFDFINTPCTSTLQFYDSSQVAPFSWLWNFDDGTTSSLQNPIHTYTEPGIYNAQLIVKNIYGCADTSEVQFDNSISLSVSKDTLICEGGGVRLLASGGIGYSWLPVSGLNDPSIADPTASPSATTTYTVHIQHQNALGDTCFADLTTTVNVIDISSIFLDATVDKDTVVKGESTILHAITNPGLNVQWVPSAGVSNPTAFDTQVTPSETTTYTVTITGSSGCSKSDTVTIYIVPNECEDENVFVPNTFTPNGDGQNDILYARSNNLTTFYFAVYNRWGELVFETSDLSKGWDGIYKGMKADPAVFAWYVKGKCFNGKEFFKKGNVTLIR